MKQRLLISLLATTFLLITGCEEKKVEAKKPAVEIMKCEAGKCGTAMETPAKK